MTRLLSDEALMLRFQEDGDALAFEELFRRHKDAFHGFLWRLSRNDTVAEEVSQYCWLKLIEAARRGRYRAVKGATFRTYLYALGRNRYIDAHCRSHAESRTRPWDETDDQTHPAEASDPEAAALRDEYAGLIAVALRALPPEQQEVVALWAGDFSTEEMASLTDAPRDTVLSRKKYAIAKLRRIFREMGLTATET